MTSLTATDLNRYANIKHIRVKFKQHIKRIYSDAHVKLNNIYSHSLTDIDSLFTSPDRTTIDKNYIKTIRTQIIATLSEYFAEAGQPTNDVPERIDNLPISCKVGAEYSPLRRASDLAFALDHAIGNNVNIIYIWLHIDEMNFKPEFDPSDINQWGNDIEQQDPTTNPSTPSKNAPDGNLSLTPEFQKLIVDMSRGQLSHSISPIATQELFNINALPPDVRLRYDKHSSNLLINGNEMKPYITNIPETQNPNKMRNCHYHLDPPGIGHRLITRDGTVFHLRDHGAKSDQMFITGAPSCKGSSPADIRAWYMAFTAFAASKGKYVHPYFCFRKDHLSSNRGFSVGEDDDHTLHDLPSRYAPTLGTWSQQIHQAISSSKVFPTGTCDEQIRIIKSHSGGHGYEALLAIIQLEHPIYHPHPTTAIRNPPRQGKSEALSGYFYRYIDYLQLRAYLKNVDRNLDDTIELDDFLDGTLYRDEFRRLIREDRKSKLPEVLVQFSQNRIVGTLERLKADYISNKVNSTHRPRSFTPRTPITTSNRVNNHSSSRGTKHPPTAPTKSPIVKTAKVNIIELNPISPLDNLEEPAGLSQYESINSFSDNYKAAVINNVNHDPRSFDTSKPCLVCGKSGHTFDDCPILSNIPHLKKHYISWKMFLTKERHRQKELEQQEHINQLESEYIFTENEQDIDMEDTIEFSPSLEHPRNNSLDFR